MAAPGGAGERMVAPDRGGRVEPFAQGPQDGVDEVGAGARGIEDADRVGAQVEDEGGAGLADEGTRRARQRQPGRRGGGRATRLHPVQGTDDVVCRVGEVVDVARQHRQVIPQRLDLAEEDLVVGVGLVGEVKDAVWVEGGQGRACPRLETEQRGDGVLDGGVGRRQCG